MLATFDTDLNGVVACKEDSSGWDEFAAECTSHANGTVTVRTRDYVPWVTTARVDCSYATDDACSPCIEDSLGELQRPNIDISDSAAGYGITTGDAPAFTAFGPHVQGIARLSDIVQQDGSRIGRAVLTHNLWPPGLIYAEQAAIPGDFTPADAIYRSGCGGTACAGLEEVYEMDIRSERDHPGGAQAHGNVVAVAMEQGPTYASVDFYRFPQGQTGYLLNRLVLDGSQGEPFQEADTNGAASAGFIMLEDGHYLVAVAGRKHGTQGVWFYRSDRPVLESDTEWEFISFWGLDLETGQPVDGWPAPPCAERAGGAIEEPDSCFGGASGLALLADCNGSVRMVVMNGTDRTAGDEFHWNQIYRLTQRSDGAVVPIYEYWQRDRTGTFQTDNPAFRWAGGLYVSEEGLPVLFNTERRTNVNDNDKVNGDLYF